MTARVVVAGIGNDFRRDDGAGPAVARLVAASTGAEDIGPIAEPLDLVGRWEAATLAVLVDATRSDAPAGTVCLVDLGDADHQSNTSTHAIGLDRVVRLAQALGSAPNRVVVVGVEGLDFSDGTGLSPPVRDAVPLAARRIADLITETA
ncbi:MAG TPA: hydrogenase maturation protease [Acidimicrobiales bacterium]|nr:hydrogenase maturation protease [Acidimicrobiales bacterium]